MKSLGDVHMDVLCVAMRPYCPPEAMEAEDTLFTLYTSGARPAPFFLFFFPRTDENLEEEKSIQRESRHKMCTRRDVCLSQKKSV